MFIEGRKRAAVGVEHMVKCRLCGSSSLSEFLDLGFTPPADQFLTKAQLSEPETSYPLRVVRCDKCFFIQLNYVVPPTILYQNDYPYEASVTKTGSAHFNAFAASVVEAYGVRDDDLVVDIGSNVGVLLSGFKSNGVQVLGVDPAANIAAIAESRGIPTIADFFSLEVARRIATEHRQAKVITGSNVFAHIDDLRALMSAVDALLADDGIFVIEAPYFVNLVNSIEYDTIYHEHLSYISILPLLTFFRSCGFELFDVQDVDIHGGSIRMFVGRRGKWDGRPSIDAFVQREADNDVYALETLEQFARNVRQNRHDLLGLLRGLKQQGHRIAAVSAPAKGMTLLNYCRIGDETLDFVTEKSTLKIGKYTPGGHLPVLPDSALLEHDIDYALLLAWNFKEEIMANLAAFKERGGKFIIPIPKPEIV